MPFARTKIQPPQPRAGSLIERPALEARLGRALLDSRLVLLVAPAGFGKTSVLARALQRLPSGTAVAWIGCDVGDSPGRLFECLVAALEPYDLPWRTAPEALARSAAEAPSPASRARIAGELINALDACEVPHGVIVVDDLHRIDRPEVFEFVGLLLERFTPRWTFVISTRQEPPLPLARLRATAEVFDLRADDLRFAPDEARSLAAAAGLEAGAADRLYLRTQGWPAGLRLALSARAPGGAVRDGGAIDRAVFDFLADEVIDRLPEAMREFLLRTSVLPELTAGRCAALSGQADAALRLEELERSGLFVTPLAASEPTLRLHDLFREALQARLQRERPREIAPLLERAAATETDAVRRVSWLQRAESWTAAEDVLVEAAEGLITQGQGSAVEALLAAFPPAQRETSPRLQLIRALYGWARWDWAIAIDASSRVAALCAAAGDREAERSARSYHCVALAGANRAEADSAVRALLADPALAGPALGRTLIAACWVAMRGAQHEVAPHLARMLDTLETIDNPARWYECSPLPPFVGLPGTRAPLQRYLAGVWRRLPEQPTPLRGMCQVIQAWLHLWVGEVEQAEACLQAAEGDARWLARPVNVDSYARALRSVLLALRGRGEEALATAEGLLAEMDAPEMPPARRRVYRRLYLFMAMRVAALLDERAALARHAGALARLEDADHTWLSKAQRSGADAHLAWAQGDLDAACAHWRGLLSRAGASDLYGQVVDARLRLADTLLERGRPATEAAAVLRPLFEAVDGSGEWGAVLLAGPALLERLAARVRGGPLEAATQDRLAQWARAARALVAPEVSAGAAPSAASAAAAASARAAAPSNGQDRAAVGAVAAGPRIAPLAVPLSARELEVLERIAAGDSNKLIARAFDLSPHTVKRHVANILDKLALQSRGQAAAWYRAQR